MLPFGLCCADGGYHLPELGLWLDARRGQTGPEAVFVSHAHSDHVAAHREVILTEPTARLMRARVSGKRLEYVRSYGEPTEIERGGETFRLTLLPAGHILGSAMALIETASARVLYTGDFKLRRSQAAEPCDPTLARGCDVLVMETTFGRPRYRFPDADVVMAEVFRFCRRALEEDRTPVVLGYSLGKSQECLRGLAGTGLPISLHPQVLKLTRIYESFGVDFPSYREFAGGESRGSVVLWPATAGRVGKLEPLGPTRTAVLTGWAMDPGCRYQWGVDAVFPLSDHADFGELLELVERVQPRRVLTVHGFTAEFAQGLRERGVDAQPFEPGGQLLLPF